MDWLLEALGKIFADTVAFGQFKSRIISFAVYGIVALIAVCLAIAFIARCGGGRAGRMKMFVRSLRHT